MATSEQKKIALTDIRENPSALRSVNRQDAGYLGLVDSIRSRGVLNPIVVRPLKNEAGDVIYSLVDGLHRYTASMDAGWTDIPANVLDLDEAATMEAQLIANVHKIETQPAQYSKHLQRILTMNPLMTMSQLAAKLSKSVTWLSERLGLLKLSNPIQKLVDEGKINLTNAYMLARLPEDEQASWVDRAASMTPQEFTPSVVARKKEIDQLKRQGRDPKPAEFTPVAHARKLSELKSEVESPSVGPNLCSSLNITDPSDGFALGIRWALHLDPDSVAIAKAKDDARKADLEKKKQEAAAERARLKAQEGATVAASVAA